MSFFRSCRVIINLFITKKIPNFLNEFSTKNIPPLDKNKLIKLIPMEKFVLLPNPVKSASDKKDYR